MSYDFFAMVSRMKHIERWALMRNSDTENISEHSLEVAMIAYGLAVIGNVRLGKQFKAERAALIGMYHDTTEIITGDMPTPVKYFNDNIKTAFKEVEEVAAKQLLNMLPKDLRFAYQSLFFAEETEKDLWKLVKAADKISALIKCIKEEKAGNREFLSAEKAIYKTIKNLALEEVEIFLEEFLPSYTKTLDELQSATIEIEDR